jgi:hypothetical protein
MHAAFNFQKCAPPSGGGAQQAAQWRRPPAGARAAHPANARAVYHPNRFVRETAHFTLKSLCLAALPEELAAFGDDLAPRIADGLSDNWSQVHGTDCRSRRIGPL